MKLIIALSAFFICLISCKKEEPVRNSIPAVSHKFSAEALQFVTLPLNRYFIYQDSASGSIDSVVVEKCRVENKIEAAVPCSGLCWPTAAVSYQEFILTLKKMNSPSRIWMHGKASNYSMSYLPDSSSGINMTDSVTPLSSIWFPLSTYYGEYTFIPTLTIEGTDYADVHLFSRNNGGQPGQPAYSQTDTYWVKGTGIIMRRIIKQSLTSTAILLRNG